MRFILLGVFLGVFSFTPAQDSVKTSVLANEVINRLTNNSGTVSWAIPVSQTETVALDWTERKTSFSTKENIRTFVGYHNTSFLATLSIQQENVSADVNYNGGELAITTSQDGFLVIVKKQEKHNCGSCGSEEKHPGEEYSFLRGKKNSEGLYVPGVSRSVLPAVYNTAFGEMANAVVPEADDDNDGVNVLRIYRLALPIAYNVFDGTYGRDVNKAKEFWARSETYLNELYMRDVGIKFQVINDERIISKDKDKDPVKDEGSSTIVLSRTGEFLRKNIGDDAYDLGVFVARLSGVNGEAILNAAYNRNGRTAAAAGMSLVTIAHEIGHMFGANHTHSEGASGGSSNYSEPGTGTSIMSYGAPRTFFSLTSVKEIYERLHRVRYYNDEGRKNLVNLSTLSPGNNYPYGIKSSNQQPVMDRTKLKTTYTIPKQTFFQFDIKATDADGDKLLYMAHQVDKRNAQFRVFQPSEDNAVTFQTRYLQPPYPPNIEYPYTTPATTGTYSFLVAASDGGNKSTTHHTLYDMEKVTVKIVEGAPFKITSEMKKKYKGGDKVQLQWSVDKTIFPEGSKARILLSADFGKTFKYVLKEEVPNNGSCEVSLPNVTIGQVKIRNNVNAGVIKIEAIDNIAYALTEVDPEKGGFLLATNAALPITLLDGSFTGRAVDKHIELAWKTGVESATGGFAVERSANGLDFESIGKVAAKGSNSSYVFTDTKPLAGRNYYRLAFLKTAGGAAKRSYVISVDAGTAAGNIKVYPNPAVSSINVEMPDSGAAVIYNMAGAAVQHLSLQKGTNTVNISTLSTGVYILRTAAESVKFVKQ